MRFIGTFATLVGLLLSVGAGAYMSATYRQSTLTVLSATDLRDARSAEIREIEKIL